MLQEFKKNRFRDSVRDLFISRQVTTIQSLLFGWRPAIFCLRWSYAAESGHYREISNWLNFYNFQDEKFQPYSLKIVNHAYADGLNKYEAAALLICHFLAVDTDEEGDWLVNDTESEYSKIYSLFDKSPIHVYRLLNSLRDSGDTSSKVCDKIEQTFSALFQKYPEFKQEAPEQPAKITWWELAYNDSKKGKHSIVGRFLTVSELVKYIENKEGGNNLFWKYPFKCQYDDWEPTMPPAKDFPEKSIMAISRQGWETLWKKYDGHPLGANFDHWEALKKEADIRPKDRDIIAHKITRNPYQREMPLEALSG